MNNFLALAWVAIFFQIVATIFWIITDLGIFGVFGCGMALVVLLSYAGDMWRSRQ